MTFPDAPVVSVTIVTYNHADFIGPCLESIVTQETTFPFEVVVGEDCSTDGTARVVAEYAARYPHLVRPLFHRPNIGVNANWNAVLQQARGEFIAHLDGDDRMLPGKLQRQVEFLREHPEVAACFHNARVIDAAGQPMYEFTTRGSRPPMDLEDVVRDGTPYCHSTKMVRRSAMPAQLDPRTRFVLDWLVHIENARHGGLAYIDEVLGEYRRHPDAFTMADADRTELLLADQLYTVQRGRQLGASGAAAEQAEARLYYGMALRFLRDGDYDRFGRFIRSSRQRGSVTRAQAVTYRLRNMPRLARLLAAVYDGTVARYSHGGRFQGASGSRSA